MPTYPAEVDVFSGPHSRMKGLVEVYLKRLENTDFGDADQFQELLSNLNRTFAQFRRHEEIENSLIIKRLRSKLRSLSVFNDAVYHCHEDSQLQFITELLEEGYFCFNKSVAERLRYGKTLRDTLKQFTEVFVPHMVEEEEIFQPLLLKYFEYDELIVMKSSVIEKHLKYEQDEKNESVEAVKEESYNAEDLLPRELWLQVFTFVTDPKDLLKCSQVCKSWNQVVLSTGSPTLWKTVDLQKFVPVKREETEKDKMAEPRKLSEQFLTGFVDSFLKRVGRAVQSLDFSGENFGEAMNSSVVRDALEWTPELRHLNLSGCVHITSLAFRSSGGCDVRSVTLSRLTHLNLSGCQWVDDQALRALVSIFDPRSTRLESLNLSGCWLITNFGLQCFQYFSQRLQFLDLSGVYLLTGGFLSNFVYEHCPSLAGENLYYCDHIFEGPFQAVANGCQNLESNRPCCQTWCSSRTAACGSVELDF